MKRSLPIAVLLSLFAAHTGGAQTVQDDGEFPLAEVAPIGVRGISGERVGLPARMEGLLRAISKHDVDSVASFFPRRGAWTYRRTTHTRAGRQIGRWMFGPGDVKRAIQSEALRSSFSIDIEGQPVGTLSHQMGHRTGRWRQFPGARFVPPGGTGASDIFVTWRLEDGAWVVSTLADESFREGVKLPSWCC